MRNRFGEVQEKIGEALMPKLMELMEWIEGDGGAAIDGGRSERDATGWHLAADRIRGR